MNHFNDSCLNANFDNLTNFNSYDFLKKYDTHIKKFVDEYVKEIINKKEIGTIIEMTYFYHLILFLHPNGFWYDNLNYEYYLSKNNTFVILRNDGSVLKSLDHVDLKLFGDLLQVFAELIPSVAIKKHHCKYIGFKCQPLFDLIIQELCKLKFTRQTLNSMKKNFNNWKLFDYDMIVMDTLNEINYHKKLIKNLNCETNERYSYIKELYKLKKKLELYEYIEKEIELLPNQIKTYSLIVSNIELFMKCTNMLMFDVCLPSAPCVSINTVVLSCDINAQSDCEQPVIATPIDNNNCQYFIYS